MTRPLYAPTYDYLKGRADALGGVGHGRFVVSDYTDEPCCIWGMLTAVPDGPTAAELWATHAPPLRYAGITPMYSDSAFGVDEKLEASFRLSFDEWARRLQVARWVPHG